MEKERTLENIVEETRNRVYLPEYRSTVSDSRVMGVVVSQYFKWNGVEILETAFSALEDANFHAEARVVQGLLDKYATA